MKAVRQDKCRKIKVEVRGGSIQKILFSDEKIFIVDPVRNTRDHCERLPKGSPRNVTIEKSHFPKSIMVWAGVSGLGNVELVFFDANEKKGDLPWRELPKPGSERRGEILGPRSVPQHRMDVSAGLDAWPWSQEYPCLVTANHVKEGCWVKRKDIWLRNSPVLNPLDFAVWSVLETNVCATSHDSVNSLERSLKTAWKEIMPKVTAGILKNFQNRLNALIKLSRRAFRTEFKYVVQNFLANLTVMNSFCFLVVNEKL
ncbi:hypothetical protein QR680_008155 [Steinernema hermaphroditum]|uniref:Uncharacterized protein n=1 Tax=Steinernema hermaphroditum TaxID=289476 RepID=A0AA39IHZ0_9BILA|nr:hypothetical protein QR680_008155 [Steinernema hermaphroditum]